MNVKIQNEILKSKTLNLSLEMAQIYALVMHNQILN